MKIWETRGAIILNLNGVLRLLKAVKLKKVRKGKAEQVQAPLACASGFKHECITQMKRKNF